MGEVALPDAVRRSQLCRNLVDATLRFRSSRLAASRRLPNDAALPDNFLARRTAETQWGATGIVAFRASPVWILRRWRCLRRRPAADPGSDRGAEGQGPAGNRRASSRPSTRCWMAWNGRRRVWPRPSTPPLDVASCRRMEGPPSERSATCRRRVSSLESIRAVWADLKAESARQERSIFETSSVMAVSAARALPGGVRWLSTSARVGAARTGQVFAAALLDHYRQTLSEIQQVGYLTYAGRQFRPYVRAAADQFSPKRRTLTQRLLERLALKRRP